MKSKTTAILLCFVFGIFGIHRFHLGHKLIGVIQLLTLGAFGIWTLIDFFRLIYNPAGVHATLQVNQNEKNTELSQDNIFEEESYSE